MPAHKLSNSAGKKKKTPRNELMLHKLRNGLEEYVRLYNPITTKWRELKLRANKGKNRIRLVGMDDDDDDDDGEDDYSDYEDELGGRSLMESALGFDRHDIEHDDILAPLFTRRLLQKSGSYDTYEATTPSSAGGSRSAREPLRPLQGTQAYRGSLGSLTHRGATGSNIAQYGSSVSTYDSNNLDETRKENIKDTLKQMGVLKKNIAKRRQSNVEIENTGEDTVAPARREGTTKLIDRRNKKLRIEKEIKRRASERRLSLSVITESPTKMDNKHSSPTKDVIKEENAQNSASTDRSRQLTRRDSKQRRTSKESKTSGSRDDKHLQSRDSKGSIEEQQYAAYNLGGKRGRARRKKKSQRFRSLVRLSMVLRILWKTHSSRVGELLQSFDALDALVGPEKKTKKQNKDDIAFDVSYFKTTDEARIPREAKRILQAKPVSRSPDELHYLKIALRNYQAIVEYPMHMQVMLSERAWYEAFDQKRVIVREGHKPLNFYFILSGAVIISKYDQEKNINKTVTFLGKGDAFGDLAILNNTVRETTVITKEKTEFLVITHSDFRDIFTSGGLGNPKDPFLNSLWYLKGWPLELLMKNPKKALFNFFKRDVVLSIDTVKSDWIYIVKSGSLSVYKQLKFEQPSALKPTLIKPKKKKKIEHRDKLNTIFNRQMQVLDGKKVISRQLMQPMANELGIPINDVRDAYGEYGYKQSRMDSSSNGFPGLIRKDTSKVESDKETPSQQPSGQISRERSSAAIEMKNSTKKVSFAVSGAILTKSNMKPHPPSQEIDPNRISVLNQSIKQYKVIRPGEDDDELGEGEEETSSEDGKESTASSKNPQHQFVTVQTLIKSGVFGLADVVYGAENMPSFSLVSNGAEVIMIDKKLFDDNASQRLMTDLREQIYPYPNDVALQEMLRLSINWDFNCKSTLLNTLYEVGVRNSNVHDARSELELHRPNPLEILI